jgi:hypothetical protein
MKWTFAFFALVFPFFLNANSVMLYNNSAYDLRAVIRGSDGSFLGEVIVPSQKEITWTDSYGQYGMYGGSSSNPNKNYQSRTPYTVLWYCQDGTDYGVCDNVATGGLVIAQNCPGTRQCKPSKKGGSNQPGSEGHYLYTPSPE